MFTRNPKKVKLILLVTFLLSSGLGIVLSLIKPYQVFRAVTSQAAKAQTEAVKFSSPTVRGFGILGDSNSDEYQADDKRGGRQYRDTTLSWMEQLVLKRGLNFGPWGTWDEPRRSGYEYNWARSGATAKSMITSGQHTGLAQQVAAGEVSHALIWIGMNDFATWNGTYDEIYWGKLSEAELQAKVEGMIADITLAVDTLLQAGDVKIVILTIPDRGMGPEEQKAFPKPNRRQLVTDVLNQVNAGIIAMAKARDIEVVDTSQVGLELLARVDKNGSINVGGVPISVIGKGNSPYYMRLDDEAGHLGTVGSGLMANFIFIKPFNERFGLNITPFNDEEILANADIAPAMGPPNYLGIVFLCIALGSAFALANQAVTLPPTPTLPTQKKA